MKHTILKYSLLFLMCVMVDRFVESQTHLFTTCAISAQLTSHVEDSLPPKNQDEVSEILNQPFTFWNAGGQSYIFLSQDGNYVLKFFKMYRYRLPCGLDQIHLPPSLDKVREKWSCRKQSRLKRDFSSYQLAYKEFQAESGLLYLHLNRTEFFPKSVRVIDNLGIAHSLNLNETPFLLQKRATLAYEAIDTLMQKGEIEEAKNRITCLVNFNRLLYQKGLYNRDAVLETNYGFDGDTPLLLDIGRLQKSSDVPREDFGLIMNRLREWLAKSHPELLDHLGNI